MDLTMLDHQLRRISGGETPELPVEAWGHLATTIHHDVVSLGPTTMQQLRADLLIPSDRYVEEMEAFQAWTDIAKANSANPVIVRAQVITELYVAFVWLRDSVMKPAAAAVPDGSALGIVEGFLSSGQRRLFRNAIAHGRWCYRTDFSGLEYWARPNNGQSHQRFEISQEVLGAWQVLSRGTAIAVLLALSE